VEKVFVHTHALSRDIYIKTPSHCFGNHQSNVRYWSKMRLPSGSKIAQATGADQVPAVRETRQDGGGREHHRRPGTARSTRVELA
jgi:4-hydroxyphenylacetate 3-monooxygenase